MLFDIAFLTKVLGDTINDEDVELGFAAKHFEPGIQSSVVTTLRTLVRIALAVESGTC